MNDLNDDRQKLAAFLKQYRPIPPKAAQNFEEQLMAAIEKQPQVQFSTAHKSFNRHLWAIPSLLVAGILLSWGGYRLFNSSPQVATDPELELFLVNGWNASLGESTSIYSPLDDWLGSNEITQDFSSTQP